MLWRWTLPLFIIGLAFAGPAARPLAAQPAPAQATPMSAIVVGSLQQIHLQPGPDEPQWAPGEFGYAQALFDLELALDEARARRDGWRCVRLRPSPPGDGDIRLHGFGVQPSDRVIVEFEFGTLPKLSAERGHLVLAARVQLHVRGQGRPADSGYLYLNVPDLPPTARVTREHWQITEELIRTMTDALVNKLMPQKKPCTAKATLRGSSTSTAGGVTMSGAQAGELEIVLDSDGRFQASGAAELTLEARDPRCTTSHVLSNGRYQAAGYYRAADGSLVFTELRLTYDHSGRHDCRFNWGRILSTVETPRPNVRRTVAEIWAEPNMYMRSEQEIDVSDTMRLSGDLVVALEDGTSLRVPSPWGEFMLTLSYGDQGAGMASTTSAAPLVLHVE
jgi:hypothetical protein